MYCRALLGALTVVTPVALTAQDVPIQEVDYRIIHEEPQGGADSAISPDGEWMAFSSRRSGNVDLWLVEVETGELRQLTDAPSRDYEPRWHPDGTHLVFVSDRDRDRRHGPDIYSIDLKTLKVTQETRTEGMADYPSYSKDGKQIVYTSGHFNRRGVREVWVKDLPTGENRQVTEGHVYVGSSSFSADDQEIVFHAYYDGYGSERSDIWVVNARTGGVGRNITNTKNIWDYKAVWSFEGDWVTFSSKRDTDNFNVYVMRSDGSDLRPLTTQQGPDFRWPNFTRDGRVAWHGTVEQQGQIKMVDVQTREVKDLVKSSSYVGVLLPSPDGNSLLYDAGYQLYVLDATNPTARPRRLGRGRDPRWSADGESVVWEGLRDRFTWSARITDTGPGDRVRFEVSRGRAPAGASATSPDGTSRVAITDGALVVSTGDRQLTLVEGDDLTSPVWSPDGKYVFFCESTEATVRYYMTVKSAANNQ